jgi:hypothetical protein
MADHVYRRFGPEDLFETRIHAQPLVVVESGSTGWSGNMNGPSGSLSLYGGVRSRADVSSGSAGPIKIYPIDLVDTHSIDKVIGIPGSYPATGSILVATCTDSVAPNAAAVTPTRWYDEHHRPIEILSGWYHDRVSTRYPKELPNEIQVVSVPSMFYGRQIATGSVKIVDNTVLSGSSKTFIDDGRGSMILSGTDVGAGVYGHVFYNEGFVVFTSATLGQGFYTNQNPRLHIEFKGSTIVNSKTVMCRMGPGEVNASSNPTFYRVDEHGVRRPKASGKTYVTAIGIYNEERELVAVAKLAQPIRKRETDDIDIRLRLDI